MFYYSFENNMQYDKRFYIRVHISVDYVRNWWPFNSIIHCLLKGIMLKTGDSFEDEEWQSVLKTKTGTTAYARLYLRCSEHL